MEQKCMVPQGVPHGVPQADFVCSKQADLEVPVRHQPQPSPKTDATAAAGELFAYGGGGGGDDAGRSRGSLKGSWAPVAVAAEV